MEDFSDDLVEELAGEVVGGTTRDQMLGAFSGISSRLVEMHNGAVRMHAEINDREILIWSGVRVVSDKELFEKQGRTGRGMGPDPRAGQQGRVVLGVRPGRTYGLPCQL